MNDSLIECSICQKVLNQPVILPCNHTICKKHEKECEHVHDNKISCSQCNKAHEIPSKGFQANLLAENLIKYNFVHLRFGPEHEAAATSSKYLKELIDEFKRLRENPEHEITEAIGEIRNKIDLKREEAKKEIDDAAIELIRDLDEYEARFKAGLSANKLNVPNEIEELIKSVEKSLSEWKEELKNFDQNLKKLKTIHLDAITAYKKLRAEREKIKKNLFTDEFKKLERKYKLFCDEKTDPLL